MHLGHCRALVLWTLQQGISLTATPAEDSSLPDMLRKQRLKRHGFELGLYVLSRQHPPACQRAVDPEKGG